MLSIKALKITCINYELDKKWQQKRSALQSSKKPRDTFGQTAEKCEMTTFTEKQTWQYIRKSSQNSHLEKMRDLNVKKLKVTAKRFY